MKLLVVCLMVAMAASAPQGRGGSGGPKPFPGKMTDDFFKYLGRYQKIFANPANHAALQKIFGGRSMGRMIVRLLHKKPPVAFPGHLRTNYRDSRFTLDEFMAWHPTLVALWKRFGAKPVIKEEWGMVDTDKSGFITPIKIWTMLRDANTNKFFNSFLSLLYSEWRKTQRSPRQPGFWNRKFYKGQYEKAFNGVWGRIFKMKPIPDSVIMKMSKEVERTQGPQAAKEFMEDLGMGKTDAEEGSEEAETITVQSKTEANDPVDIPVESTEGEMAGAGEPFIEAKEPVVAVTGQPMEAAAMMAADVPPMPNMPVNVTMPSGEKVEMMVAPPTGDADETQPMAEIEQMGTEQKVRMPVTKMETNGVTSTTEILTDSGSAVKVTMVTPESNTFQSDNFAGASEKVPATITDEATGSTAAGTAEPAADLSLEEEMCDGEEDCELMTVQAGSTIITLPVASNPDLAGDDLPEEAPSAGHINLTVTNEATGDSTILEDVTAVEENGEIKIIGTSSDGKTEMMIDLPASTGMDAEEGFQEGESSEEATAAVLNGAGDELAAGKVENITVSQNADGDEAVTMEVNLAGTPTEIKIEGANLTDLGLDAPSSQKNFTMTLTTSSGTEELIPVSENDESVTGMTADGKTLVTVPKPDVVKPEDGNPATGGDVMEIQSTATGEAEAVPIKAVQTDGDQQEEMVGTTSNNENIDVKVNLDKE